MAARRFPLVPVVLSTVLAVVSAGGVYWAFAPDEETPEVTSDATFPLEPTGELPSSVEEVRLAGMGGNETQLLGDFIGETPVVLNFFASWCTPCLREMPAFEAVHQQLGDEVTFIGLANTDVEDKALEMVADTGVTYPTFADPAASAVTFFGGTTMPTTVFIDAEGEVVSVDSQTFDEDSLKSRISELLGVPAAP